MQAKLVAIALCCALLSACGIKGPLYLPAPGAKVASAPAVPGADHSKTATDADPLSLDLLPSLPIQ